MIKIIADSGCDFSDEMIKYGVARVPLTLQVGGKTYVDDFDLDITQYIKAISENPRGRKTAAPSPEKYYTEYKDGDAVFVVTLSSHLSSSYESAMTAVNMYKEDFGEKFIYVIDSKSASAGQTLIVHELMKLDKLNISPDEIKNCIDKFVSSLHTYFILECFNTIVDSGRMNSYVAKLASMLNIVPICAGEDGKMALVAQARGHNKAYTKLAEIIKSTCKDTTERTLAITNVDCRDKAIKLADKLDKELGFKECLILSPTGLVCTYADHHGLVIAF